MAMPETATMVKAAATPAKTAADIKVEQLVMDDDLVIRAEAPASTRRPMPR